MRSERLARRGLTTAALMDSVQEGETAEDVKKRLGKPAEERWSVRTRRVRQRTGNAPPSRHWKFAVQPGSGVGAIEHGATARVPSFDNSMEAYGPGSIVLGFYDWSGRKSPNP